MRRFTKTAWWVLPIAVALTGSVAVGAAVNRSVDRRSSALPEVAVPTPIAKGSPSAPSRGSVGVVLGGRALVPVSGPAGAPTTTTPLQAGAVPGTPQREDAAGTRGQEPAGQPGEDEGTTTSTVPPPTIVTVPEDGNEDGKGDDSRERSNAPAPGSAGRGEGD